MGDIIGDAKTVDESRDGIKERGNKPHQRQVDANPAALDGAVPQQRPGDREKNHVAKVRCGINQPVGVFIKDRVTVGEVTQPRPGQYVNGQHPRSI